MGAVRDDGPPEGEKELTVRLISAAYEQDQPLSQQEVDDLLGVGRDERPV